MPEGNIKTNFDINVKTSGFCKQLHASIIRGFFPLSRNKRKKRKKRKKVKIKKKKKI